MSRHQLDLLLLPGSYAVCKLPADSPFPGWARGDLTSFTRAASELSVVCRAESVPGDVLCERGWRVLRVAGQLDFSLVGVLASLVEPLALAGISVFSMSTFDTDYLLVREASLPKACTVLGEWGHTLGGCPLTDREPRVP